MHRYTHTHTHTPTHIVICIMAFPATQISPIGSSKQTLTRVRNCTLQALPMGLQEQGTSSPQQMLHSLYCSPTQHPSQNYLRNSPQGLNSQDDREIYSPPFSLTVNSDHIGTAILWAHSLAIVLSMCPTMLEIVCRGTRIPRRTYVAQMHAIHLFFTASNLRQAYYLTKTNC
jgi:hypothetical protein